MYRVSTVHKDHGSRRVEHVFSTDGAITFCRMLNLLDVSTWFSKCRHCLRSGEILLDWYPYICYIGHNLVVSDRCLRPGKTWLTEKVLAYTTTDSAYTAIDAMVYMLLLVVVPKFTLVTIVEGHPLHAVWIGTRLRGWLRSTAKHTKHILRCCPYELMILMRFVMTKSACCPRVTSGTSTRSSVNAPNLYSMISL